MSEVLNKEYNILCLDDEETQILVYQTIFCKLKSRVDFFTSPTQAVESVKNKIYNLVILDLNMPEMNGVEVYNKIYDYYNSSGIKIPKFIMVTAAEPIIKSQIASANFSLGRLYKSIGFSSYYNKPINYSEFFEDCLYLLTVEL